MKHPIKVKRIFNKTDRAVILQGQGMHGSFIEHILDFEEKYPFLDLDWGARFQAKIDLANEITRDREVVADISVDASKIEGFMSEGTVYYMNIIHYARILKPNNPSFLATFGHKDYEEYSRVQTLFPIILDQAFAKANDPILKPLLIELGLKVTDITKVDTISKAIKEEVKILYREKVERLPNTEGNVIKYNDVWSFMSELSDCAKDVYSNNWAMYRMFLLYPEDETGTTPPEPPVPPVE